MKPVPSLPDPASSTAFVPQADMPLHERRIVCTSKLRTDGLIEIEARLEDITGPDTDLVFKRLSAGDTIHDMHLMMTLDQDLVIQEVRANIHAFPTPTCPGSTSGYASLAGLRIGPGFQRHVRERVGGALGCTHMNDLLGPLATTAMQAFFSLRRMLRIKAMDVERLVDTCHSYREGSPTMQVLRDRQAKLQRGP